MLFLNFCYVTIVIVSQCSATELRLNNFEFNFSIIIIGKTIEEYLSGLKLHENVILVYFKRCILLHLLFKAYLKPNTMSKGFEFLASTIPHCSINDPNVGNCILSSAIKLRPRFRNGIKELGIPTYNPLLLSNFNVIQESTMVNYTATLWNFTIRGIESYDFSEIQYNPKTTTFTAKFQIDPLAVNSIYEFKGNLLFIYFTGKGNVKGALGPINATFELDGKITKRNNKEYFDTEAVKVGLSIDDMSVHFNGLFDGDNQNGAKTNLLINQNSKMIIDAVTPALEELSQGYIMRYFKWLTNKYPIDVLFAHS